MPSVQEKGVATRASTMMLPVRRFLYLTALVVALLVRACIGAALIRTKLRRGDLQVLLARTIVRTVERMGPAATKLAQIASARNDIFPQRFCGALSSIQDQVRPPSKGELDNIRTDLARKLDLHIAAEPIAAGSIAVVLKATTREGLTLALKVSVPVSGAACAPISQSFDACSNRSCGWSAWRISPSSRPSTSCRKPSWSKQT